MRVLTIFLALVLLSGCAGASSGAATAASPAADPTSIPLAAASTAATTPVPSPTPIAVLDGEPWIVYSWADDQGWYLSLMRPDGTGAHGSSPTFRVSTRPRPGRRTARSGREE